MPQQKATSFADALKQKRGSFASALDEVRNEPPPPPADTWGQFAADIAKGAGKGILNTAIGLGDITGRAGLNRLTGGTPEMFQAAREEYATPTNTAQKIGSGVEQIAEFFVPAGSVARGAAAASRFVPRFLGRAATEAASAGAVTAAQGGDPTLAAAAAGAFPVAGRALTGTANRLRKQASKQVVQALGPTKERFKAIAERRAPEFMRRGIVGSREGIEAKATQLVDEVGGQIDEALAQYAKDPVSTRPIVEALEQAKTSSIDTTASGMPVVLNSRTVNQIQQLQNTIEQYGPQISVESLVKVRRAWDVVVAQAGGYAHRAGGAIGLPLKEQSEAWAKREGASAIRRVLANEKPDVAALNAEYAFWKDIQDVIRQTLKRTAPQEKGLVAKVAASASAGGFGGGALAADMGLGGAATTALVAGYATKKLVQAMQSPQWRLVSARVKNKLADALISGNTERINTAVGRVVAATSGGATSGPR